jgi:hypothetical protein
VTEAICHAELAIITERGRTLTAAQALGSLAENSFNSARSEEVEVPIINNVSRRVAILLFHSLLDASSHEQSANKTDACHHGYDIRFDALSSR